MEFEIIELGSSVGIAGNLYVETIVNVNTSVMDIVRYTVLVFV